jgi:hypothetical protein
MNITEEYLRAVREYEASVKRVSEILVYYRDSVDLVRVSGPEDELEAASQRYEEASTILLGAIVPHLIVRANGDAVRDHDAVARMIAVQQTGAEIVLYTSLIIAFRDPAPDDQALRPGALSVAELDTLGHATVAEECAPAFTRLHRADAAAATSSVKTTEPAVPAAFKVKPYFDTILGQAAGDVIGTIGSGLPWKKMIDADLADAVHKLGIRSVDWLQKTVNKLRLLLIRAWRQVLTNVRLLVGPDAQEVGTVAGEILDNYRPDAVGWTLSTVLGKTLKIHESESAAQQVADQYPARASQMKDACDKVGDHYADHRKVLRRLNPALPFLLLIPGYGVQAQVTAAALLLLYEVWLAHDHLDSPVLEKLRIRGNTGLRTAVTAAATA